nr:ParB/RepB/Spo0J family partition protein [uncultured Dethiosulfovibrio sp.]
MAQKRSLGKGLGALLPQGKLEAEELLLTEIVPNPDQPRKTFPHEALEELAQSIKNHGIIQPILVKVKDGQNTIVAGERRWRAASLAGLEKAPVRYFHGTDEEILEVSLIENLQREDLSPLETATSLQEMIKKLNITQEEAATKVGWSRSAVANKIRLLNLPPLSRDLLEQGRISEGHGRLLLSLRDNDEIDRTASRCVQLGWSVKDLERHLKEGKKGTRPPKPQTPDWGRPFRDRKIGVAQRETRGKVNITISGLTKGQAQAIGEILSQAGDRLFPGE